MNRYPYDFHVHSCLSPCGDNDVTPNNLVQMALLSGCEILALTDHNTCRNAPAAMEAGERYGLLVVPGMELCTSEEAHVVCLFETLEGALAFDRYVYDHMPHVPNRPEIFGDQKILDGEDRQVGEEENLLLVSSFISVDQVVPLTAEYGGAAFPAHVNKDSYSVIASLGALPPEAGFAAAEVTRDCDLEAFTALHPELAGLRIFRSSDSHYLETLAGEPWTLGLAEKSRSAVIDAVRGKY